MDTDYYISEISKMSNRFGDKLANMMKRYGKTNLREITRISGKPTPLGVGWIALRV